MSYNQTIWCHSEEDVDFLRLVLPRDISESCFVVGFFVFFYTITTCSLITDRTLHPHCSKAASRQRLLLKWSLPYKLNRGVLSVFAFLDAIFFRVSRAPNEVLIMPSWKVKSESGECTNCSVQVPHEQMYTHSAWQSYTQSHHSTNRHLIDTEHTRFASGAPGLMGASVCLYVRERSWNPRMVKSRLEWLLAVTCTRGGHGETKSVQVVAETVSQPDKTGPRG